VTAVSEAFQPSSQRITYSYDAAGRLRTLDNPYNERTSFSFDQAGREIAISRANGVATTQTYDAADRLTLSAILLMLVFRWTSSGQV
jgi:YD repeat-containing protein